MIDFGYEQQRCEIVAFGHSRRTPTARGSGRPRRHDSTGSRPDLRHHAPDGGRLDQEVPEPQSRRPGGEAERTSVRQEAAAKTDGLGRPGDCQQTARSAEIAVLSLDAGSGRPTDRTEVWRGCLGLDGGAVLADVGIHAAKADSAGVRGGPGGGSPLAGGGISGHQSPGPEGKGRNLLGRREGIAVGPCDGDKLGAERTDARDSGNGPEIRLRCNLGNHQPRTIVLYGPSSPVEGRAVHRFYASAGTASAAENLPDRGPSSGASVGDGENLVEQERTPGAIVLSSGLSAGLESGLVSESGRQKQCGGATAAGQRAGDAKRHFRLPEKSTTAAAHRQKLFQA